MNKNIVITIVSIIFVLFILFLSIIIFKKYKSPGQKLEYLPKYIRADSFSSSDLNPNFYDFYK